MAVWNEEVKAVMGELERFGLTGVLEDRGKHQAILWTYPDGRSRTTIVPRTASDHRAALNARGQVRRTLRQDGVQPPSAEVVLFKKAMALPQPQDTAPDRLKRLETDVEGLLDIVGDLTAHIDELKAKLAGIRVTVSFADGSEVPLAEPAPVKEPLQALQPVREKEILGRRNSGRMDAILSVLGSGEWVEVQEISRLTAFENKHVHSGLHYLQKIGRVERGLRGMWRMKVLVPQLQQAQL